MNTRSEVNRLTLWHYHYLRSQDKGFHVEGALTHTFTRSLPYTTPQRVKMEVLLGRENVLFEIPEELSEYVNRYPCVHLVTFTAEHS